VIGRSDAFLAMDALIAKLAEYDAPVLIEGETGTGKELAARAIHYRSSRCDHPFVPTNCGAIPDALFENELFGHRRGAFTDARDDQPGLVTMAHRGTLFLDEVDALTAKGQVGLLRFLQDQQYRPLGGRSEQKVDVRVIAACNRGLDQLVAAGQFRSDLLYRLKIMLLRVPPLRERVGDAALLADHFVTTGSVRFGKAFKPLNPKTTAWFDDYGWPGNVRELENLVYREFLLADGPEILVAPLGSSMPCATLPDSDLSYAEAKAQAIEAFERTFLTAVMARAHGSVATAARLARTERRHLGRLLKRFGIERVPTRA
jgi:two-component system, NtrC family, response regulator GlrR